VGTKLTPNLQERKSKGDFIDEIPVLDERYEYDAEWYSLYPCTVLDVKVDEKNEATSILIKHFNNEVFIPYSQVKQDKEGNLYIPTWLAKKKGVA